MTVEREVLDLDILIVGAGPAGLAAALRIAGRQKAAGGEPLAVAVLEKAKDVGAHALSGAILDPSALLALVPDARERGAPLACPVVHDAVYWLTRQGAWRSPVTPPPLANHGNYVVSLGALTRWMAGEAEAAGIDVITGFSAAEVLFDGVRVAGVRTRDLGLDKAGQRKPSFQPGVDVRARVTIFCDGVRGNLTKVLIRTFDLAAGLEPPAFALGLKELWELPVGRLRPGTVLHTLGHPLTTREFGGGFIYGMPGDRAAVGFVAGLDGTDPLFDPYVAFQRFKAHPFVARILDRGSRLAYGAKSLPEGGWHTIPRVHMDGALIAGDAGGFLNAVRLKGIHLAMRSGMLAADAAFDAVKAGDTSRERLAAYPRAIAAGPIARELYPVRHVHRAFQRGVFPGLLAAGRSMFASGQLPGEGSGPAAAESHPHTLGTRFRKLDEVPSGSAPTTAAGIVDPRDRLASVHLSGTRHREDEPSHLIVHDTDICRTRCTVEYGNPCTRVCPAAVYEMIEDEAGGRRLQIHASNCVHCKACDIIDPYRIIDWVPPEGGEGPQYEGM